MHRTAQIFRTCSVKFRFYIIFIFSGCCEKSIKCKCNFKKQAKKNKVDVGLHHTMKNNNIGENFIINFLPHNKQFSKLNPL